MITLKYIEENFGLVVSLYCVLNVSLCFILWFPVPISNRNQSRPKRQKLKRVMEKGRSSLKLVWDYVYYIPLLKSLKSLLSRKYVLEAGGMHNSTFYMHINF